MVNIPLRIYFVLRLLPLAEYANSIVSFTSAARASSVALMLLENDNAFYSSRHTLDFFKRQRSQALQTRFLMLSSSIEFDLREDMGTVKCRMYDRRTASKIVECSVRITNQVCRSVE